MALTIVSIQYLDAAGISARETIQFPEAFSIAEIEGWLTATLPNINDTTACQITEVKVNYAFDFSALGLRGAPVTGSRAAVGLRLGFRDTGGQAESLFIPGLQNTWLAGGVANIGAGGDGPFDLVQQCISPGVDVGGTPVFPSSRAQLGYATFRGGVVADRDYK